MRGMSAPDPKAVRAASDPSTPPQVLWQLAHQFPQLRPRIAANPAAPPDLRARILGPQAVEETKPLYRQERPQPVPDTTTDRHGQRSVIVAIAVAAIVLVACIGIIVMSLSGGRSPRVDSSPSLEPSTPTATSPSPEPVASPSVGLSALGARGCKAASTDADLLVAFGAAYSDDSGWRDASAKQQLSSSLTALEKACGADYVSQVANTATNSGATKALVESLAEYTKTEQLRPAPAGALSLPQILSPSGNIACQLGTDQVSCSIQERNPQAPGFNDCGTTAFSIAINQEGAVSPCATGAPAAGQGTQLDYGQSTTVGDFACTSESVGMTCWHTGTGRGFTLAREGVTQF